MLGIIPGGIFGVPHYSLQTEQMDDHGAQIARFNFSQLQAELANQSTTITAAALAGGLRIEPNDTRFGRVATTIGLSETLGTLKVGFRDHVASKYVLVLVFFDRPCRLTGTLRASNGQIWSANVAIGKAGLAWLKMGDGHVTAAAVPSHFMFVISHP
jgi:hypothetical protein